MIRKRFTFASAQTLPLYIVRVSVLVAAVVAVAGCDTPSSRAINRIAQYGVATMKPAPDGSVRVFVVHDSDASEKRFGDQQLAAILPHLPQIDGLDALDLHDSSVSDASIAGMVGLNSLRELDVSNTKVTLKGLLGLKGLPKLTAIFVGPDQLTKEQLATLKAAFPAATVSIRAPG